MICIDKHKRLTIDDTINRISEFFKKQEREKIEAELKIKFEEQKKILEDQIK